MAIPGKRTRLAVLAFALVCTSVTFVAHAQDLPKDVILLLDNSGSMKKNDPGFLAKKAVEQFLIDVSGDTRVGIVIFDQDVHVAVPLTAVDDVSRGELLASLSRINYKGLYTDSPTAMERAVYELKTNARDDAVKSIIFMTDGIVDTGNEAKDVESARWMRDDLAADAGKNDIRIFGIAFTENADFRLIQSLAQKTDGEYFRAFKPEDLNDVFSRISEIIAKHSEPEPPPEPVLVPVPAPMPQPQPVDSGDGNIAVSPDIAPPVTAPAPGDDLNALLNPPVDAPPPAEIPPVAPPISEPAPPPAPPDNLPIVWIAAVGGLAVIVLALVVVIALRGRRGKVVAVAAEEAQELPKAFLHDLKGESGIETYEITHRTTMIGRVAGDYGPDVGQMVIDQTTIGRRHAVIEYKHFGYWLVDQNSLNGTYVNDKRISGEVRLKHHDKVRFDKIEFKFAMPELDNSDRTVLVGSDEADPDRTMISAGATAATGVAAATVAEAVEDDLETEVFQSEEDFSEDETVLPDAPPAPATPAPAPNDDPTVVAGDGDQGAPESRPGEETALFEFETGIFQAVGQDEDATLVPGFESDANDDDGDDVDNMRTLVIGAADSRYPSSPAAEETQPEPEGGAPGSDEATDGDWSAGKSSNLFDDVVDDDEDDDDDDDERTIMIGE